jgi:hypothetical protein
LVFLGFCWIIIWFVNIHLWTSPHQMNRCLLWLLLISSRRLELWIGLFKKWPNQTSLWTFQMKQCLDHLFSWSFSGNEWIYKFLTKPSQWVNSGLNNHLLKHEDVKWPEIIGGWYSDSLYIYIYCACFIHI